MVYKKFRYNVIVRVLLLILTIFGLVYISINSDYLITSILFSGITVLQIYSMIRYIDKTNRDLSSFLESIRYSDFSRSFQIEGMGTSFDQLRNTFNNVMLDFQKIRSEKEEHYYYLQNIIQHVEICIIAYQPDGTVEMINGAAKKLFQVSRLKNINELEAFSPELVEKLLNIHNEDARLIKVQDTDDILQLTVSGTEFVLNERNIILVTIKNIQAELEEQEMEAWQKLIRVLTHEIMNSIAPIASLTSTVNLMVDNVAAEFREKAPVGFDDEETVSDIQEALKTIHKRSTGLIHFVQTYRNLTKIPKPNFTIFPVRRLFNNIFALLRESINSQNIDCQITIEPEEMNMTADEQLIEQVIINLIKNSIHALENRENATILIKAYYNKRGRKIIQVTDNGQGIIQEVRDKIFIPFFTTKPTGSGIGLSLSKQILRLHSGTIAVYSVPEKETTFTLTFLPDLT